MSITGHGAVFWSTHEILSTCWLAFRFIGHLFGYNMEWSDEKLNNEKDKTRRSFRAENRDHTTALDNNREDASSLILDSYFKTSNYNK